MFLKCTGILALIVGLLGSASSRAQGVTLDVESLERKFARARDLKIVHKIADLPPDVKSKFLDERRGRIVAELGESWHSSGESEDPTTMPTGQHLFSAVSNDLFFILIQVGAHWRQLPANVRLYLGERNSSEFCTYVYHEMNIGRLRLDSFQYEFNVRGRTTPRGELPRSAPECVPRTAR